MARRTLLAFVAVLAACRGDASPSQIDPSAAQSAAATRSPLVAGQVHVYDFEWAIDANAEDLGWMPSDAPLQARIDLAGELGLRVVEVTQGVTRLAVGIRRLDRHELSLYGHDVIPSIDVLVGPEAFVTLRDGGDTHDVVFDRQSPPLFRHVMAGVLAQIDLAAPPSGTTSWRAQVPASNGLAEAQYSVQAAGRVRRELLGYARLDAVAGGEATVRGDAELVADVDGLPAQISSDEALRATGVHGESGVFASDTRFSLRRIGQTDGRDGGWPAPDRAISIDLEAAPSDAEAQRELARKFAEDMTMIDVERVVRSAGHGLLPRPGFAVQATGLLRGSPELATEMVAIFDDVADASARSLVFDVLASAGTTEAQHVMIELLSRPEVRADPALGVWLQRFSFVRHPVPEVLTLLVDVAEHELGEPAGRAALYPLGAVSRRVAIDDPLLGALGHAVMVDALAAAVEPDDAIAALAGLGNEAHDDGLEPLLAHVDHPDFGVRMQAASGLRYQIDPRAREALFDLLRDEDDAVARSALAALADHQLGNEAATILADATLRGAFNPAIAGAMVGELGSRVDDGPQVRQALAHLGATAKDAEVRARVDAVLAL